MNQQPSVKKPPLRAIAQHKYNTARVNLLLVIAMSVINIIFIAAQTGTYFLFSASIPVVVTDLGVYLYAETGVTASLIIFAVIALALTLPYLLCWIFSKKHFAWMIAALVYFCLDTVCMLYLFLGDLSAILDVVFHAWILYYLIIGVKYGHQLKNLPEDVAADTEFANGGSLFVSDTEPTAETFSANDSPILRTAQSEEKIKVYTEALVSGHTITYRKYGKNLEELVVDGYVYAEFTFKGIAKPHEMSAVVYGMEITAGYFQNNYIKVNGNVVAQSVRWI